MLSYDFAVFLISGSVGLAMHTNSFSQMPPDPIRTVYVGVRVAERR